MAASAGSGDSNGGDATTAASTAAEEALQLVVSAVCDLITEVPAIYARICDSIIEVPAVYARISQVLPSKIAAGLMVRPAAFRMQSEPHNGHRAYRTRTLHLLNKLGNRANRSRFAYSKRCAGKRAAKAMGMSAAAA